ncbi:MAG TPA: NlpC/P60 family protein [Thermodesulfobacteriota bacterium]|nr:NlpC/P60 family protein [Thermodesulfobacteriota bacterium]
MIRPSNGLGIGLIALLLLFGVWQMGWAGEKYTVKPGDTLYGISKSFGVSLLALKKANGLEGNSINPRQVLTIPSPGEKKADEALRSSSNSSSQRLPAETVGKTTGEMDSYVVQKGDSLSSISTKVGLPIVEIMEINGLQTTALKIGQILCLRRDESRLDDKAEELEDGEEVSGFAEREREKTESAPSAPLGTWSNPEERSLLVRVVKTFLGVPYKFGGSTLKGIDCSAFVRKIYEVFNIELPRTTREQFSIGKKVQKNQLEEGDLVFFRETGNRAHVGIYVGENQFVHASSYSKEVKIDHLDTPYYSQRFLRGVRVKELGRES